ncbi:MAG: rhomboid family intramembrane serine protease [Gammaproteobacteria bacterium]|nr:rhomboid family intramembrane serine protease [Gammaproteobacteria bacterium]
MSGFATPYTSVPPVVKSLLIVNGIMFVLQMYMGNTMIAELALWPLDLSPGPDIASTRPQFGISQLVTYAFLHGGVMHLLLNMYALWMFGSRIENLWGSKVFTVYYFVCVIGAGLMQLLVSSQGENIYPTVGASGGVFGLLLAFGMFFPREKLILIFPPIPMEARWFVVVFGAIELWFGITGTAEGIAHFAHLGGMLFGFVLILYWKKHPPRF